MKVLALGFDGASPRLIDQWVDYLPTFKSFKEKGVLGVTIPPTPAQTPVAWTTFATGNNPGNHGIFSFAQRMKGTYERKIIDPEMVKPRRLWRILSDAGMSVGVINVPMSDIENINGFIIPGFMSRNEGIPYPLSVKERIKRKYGVDRLVGDAEIDVLEKALSDPFLFFDHVNQITDDMAEVCLYLMQEEKWDFYMPVFMGLDRIQHFFWKNIDVAHPRFEENALTRLVKDFYVKIDKITSTFLKCSGEDTIFIVLSDHGFCPISREVIVNSYLKERGFLTTKQGKVDLEKSKAVSYGYGDVWLNVRGREPKGAIDPADYDAVRAEISSELKKIEIDGEKPFKDVKKREELWWGTYLSEAPDLTIIFNMRWQAARQPEITESNKLQRYVNDNPRWSGGHDGTHDPFDVPGIIGILGPNIKRHREIRVYLWDVAPTILSWMKVPVPSSVDGKPFPLES